MHFLIQQTVRLHIDIGELAPDDADGVEIIEQEIASIEAECDINTELSAGQRDLIQNNLETARAMMGYCAPLREPEAP